MRHEIGGWLLVVLLAISSVGWAEQADRSDPEADPFVWLERMSRAVRDLGYRAHFVYRHGEVMDAMLIEHSVAGDQERERMVNLTGERREVYRDRNSVTCLVPKSGKTNVDRRRAGGRFSSLIAFTPVELQSHYTVQFGGETRVADRAAVRVLIEPRDALRYGYELALDRETALPLRTITRDERGQPLSEIMFLSLQVDPLLRIKPPVLDEVGQSDELPAGEKGARRWSRSAHNWRFNSEPLGFRMNLHRRTAAVDGQDESSEHFVFTDGLATISAYVEKWRDAPVEATSVIGTANAYTVSKDGHQLTLVGEVPMATLRRLGAAAEFRPSD